MDKKNLLTIGELSKLCQITSQALRYYEKIGLLNPVLTDEETGYRYYSMDQITHLVSIKELKYRGFQLEDIRKFLDTGNLKTIEEIYIKRKKEIDHQIEMLLHYEKMLNNRIYFFHQTALLEQEDLLEFNPDKIQIKTIPERQIVFVNKKLKEFSLSSNSLLFNEMQILIRKNKLFVKEPMMNILYDSYKNINKKEMLFEVAYHLEKIPEKKQDFIKTIPAGQYACFFLKGSLDKVALAEEQFYEWMKKEQYIPSGPLIRCYLVTYAICKSKDLVVSEFQIQIQKKS